MLNNQLEDIYKKLDTDKKETNVVLQIVAFFIVSVFISIIIFTFLPLPPTPSKENLIDTSVWIISRLASSSVSVISTIIASILCINKFTNRSPHSLGLLPHKGFFKDFFVGLGISLIMIAAVALLQWLLGGTQFVWGLTKTIPFVGLVGMTVVLFIAAFEEEVIFRGYPLQTLAVNLSPVLATVITSGLFGLVHLGNPNATFFSTVNTILAGIWLCVAYFKTRSLSLATGLHLGWNFAMGTIFGLPVSGITQLTKYSLLDSRDLGKIWLTGGSYGPEGGAVTTIILILGIFALIKIPFLKISPEMAKFFPTDLEENRKIKTTFPNESTT